MAKKEKDVKEKKQKSNYFKEMKAELKKVVWPTPKELANNTFAVLVFVVILAIIVFILDFAFDNLNKYGITTMQEKVQSSFQATEDSQDEDANESSESTDSNTTDSETGADSSNEIETQVVVDGEENQTSTESTESEEESTEDNASNTESDE